MTPVYTSDARVTIPRDVLVRVINGESFILNIQSECYFGLNAVGARIFKLLTESDSIGSAFERTCLEFDVDVETLQVDFDRLIGELLQQGLLELNAAPSA
jgi:hypothetical protein